MVPKAKLFKFAGYKVYPQTRKIIFKYSIEFTNQKPLHFFETIILPKGSKDSKNLKNKSISKFLEPLSLILGISYYKLYCPTKILTSCKLSKAEADFWNTVYRKGLGEFLYRNKLDPNKLAKFPYTQKQSSPIRVSTKNKILLGIGGGKDSIVAAELLRKKDFTSFLVETQKADDISRTVIKKIGNPALILERILDPKLFVPQEGAYNGHIPISAVFAFLGLLTASIYEYRYITVGNARTSNFGNVLYKGEYINHQWSKSAEFEELFQEYTSKFITPDIKYFALLRQFNEIRVAEMFAQYEKYFSVFSSCNRNFKVFKQRQTCLWCGECPKCAFVFLVLAPFVNKEKLISIFGKNLLDDKSLISTYRDLLGMGGMKPFDCVGTFEENKTAFVMASKNYKNSTVVKELAPFVKVSSGLIGEVFKTFRAPTLPAPFKLLGLRNIAILGYGKEGKVTEKYLKKNHPNLKIKILDESIDKNYLEKQAEYDFAIKTPGISKNKVTIPYTTATNLFFSQNNNLTIGITGSKGKSTTASLIYEIIKKSGKKVSLLGNIGNPMLETLLKPVVKDEIFVIELSSYMLDDIEYSPNVAVLLNLFPEHMNYHGGVGNYYKAKENIFKFQKPGDIAIRSPFDVKIPFKQEETHLLGKHNWENVKVAVKVARVLGIPDKKIREAVKQFKGLPHRLEKVGTWKGVKFIDDSIASIPESVIEALDAVPKTNILILGGMDRGVPHTKLLKVILEKKNLSVFCIDETGKSIYQELVKKDKNKYFYFTNMESAIQKCYKILPNGGVVLLSPAAASYNQFKNFEEKGKVFKNLAQKYGQN